MNSLTTPRKRPLPGYLICAEIENLSIPPVSISQDGLTLKSSAAYTDDGNRLASTTDAACKTTTYSYNGNTNVLEWVQYPEDTEATRTEYTYDSMYRLAMAQAAVDTGYTLRASYGYTNDLLISITTRSTTYNFTCGDFGLRTQVNVGSQNIAKYTYTSQNNYLEMLEYGNNDSVQYTYDDLGRVTKQTYEDGDTVSYLYNNDGELAAVMDSATGTTSRYFYDLSGRMMRYTENATDYSHSVTYGYDKVNNLSSVMDTINGAARKTSYTYDSNNRVTKITHGSAGESYTYDSYGRVATRTNTSGESTILSDELEYRTLSGVRTSGQVYKLTTTTAANAYNASYTYTYDSNGNILSVKGKNNKTTSYVYDSANQLVRENNQAAGKTWVWAYDNAGNIENRKEYSYTTGTLGTAVDTIDYDYGDTNWGDLLTKYDGQSITYDEIGNPTSYYNGTRWSLSWEHGRELTTISNGTTTWTNTYNADGLRTKRTNGTTTYNYVYLGDKLIQMHVGDDVLKFGYDANGSPMYLQFNNSRYFYATNAQGDVMALVHTNGTAVVEYTYDAWGNILTTTGSMASTLGVINPLRYRGYVYDQETGLYYLQSRYYDPVVGRFLNADTLVSTGQGILGNNMYAYCGNNPISRIDSNGYFFFTVLGAAVGAAFGAIDAAIQGKTGDEFRAMVVSGAISGAVSGAAADVLTFTGAAVGVAVGVMAVAGATGTALGSIYEYSTTGDKIIDSDEMVEMAGDIIADAALSGLFAYMGGPIASQIDKIAQKGFFNVAKTYYTREISNTLSNLAEESLATVTGGIVKLTFSAYIRAVENSAEIWFN